jgi:ERCC4-type nuclease
MDARRTKARRASEITTWRGVRAAIHQLAVDHSERHSALLDAMRRSDAFEIRMTNLTTGDYLIDGEVLG